MLFVHSLFILFFFASRRRHTRLQGDWSSDVCSSDLRLQRLTELENRISKASAGGRRRSRGLRNHQHFNRLAGLKWKAIQNEFAMLADCSLSPVCLHALSIEDGAFRMFSRSFERNRRFTGGIPPDQRRYGIMSLDHG